MVRDASGVTHTVKIYRTRDRTRSEFHTANHLMISITDRTNNEIISMDPEKHTYFKMELGAADVSEAAVYSNAYTTTLQGEETIASVRTSKYFYEGTTNGTSIEGTVWVTSDKIPVRNVATVITAGQTIPVNSHLENLKIEKLDRTLFDVPAGYVVREMAARGARH